MKALLRKVWGGIKKPFGFIKRKTAPAREFMKQGRAGGMIAEMVMATLLNGWMIVSYTYNKYPAVLCCLVMAVLLVLFAEVLNLVLKLLFGAGKRCKSYFMVSWFFVCADNIIGTQANSIPAALIMTYLLTLAVDVLGRCIWAFARTKRFKQVFAYIAAVLSVAYIGSFLYFYANDTFGDSRIDFYNQIPVPSAEQAEGFDSYLQNGPYEVATLSYGPDESDDIVTETLDYTIFDSVQDRGGMDAFMDLFNDYDFENVPVKGQIWYPEGQTGCPVFFIVHGNHDSYVPSYLGYEYLGEYLASNGYVVISVDENIINGTGEGNDKRAILLLDNMQVILGLNDDADSVLYGLMDEDRIAIGGHSRGGEMVATAYLFNDLDAYPEDGNIRFDYHFNITSIVAIAPVVDQYMPVSHSVEISDVNYLLIHGANDQDVSSMCGEKQFNNVTFTNSDDSFYMMSSVYILGANHGQFNSLWGQYDMIGAPAHFFNTNHFLDEADQKLIARAYIRVFLDSTLGIDDTYVSLLSDISSYRSYLPETVYITNYTDSDRIMICSFDDTVNIVNCGDAFVSCTGTDTWTIDVYSRGDGGEGENYVLDLSWEEDSEPSAEFTFSPIDISNGCISFDIADMREDTEDLAEALNYTVELTDASGNVVTVSNPVLVYHSLAIQFSRQDALFGTYEYKHQLQQVVIDPSMFGDSGFDFSNVVGMRITTDGTDEGEIIIDDVAYWS